MQVDDEMTAAQLHVQVHCLLEQCSYNLPLQMVLHCQPFLGWTFRGSAYCQLFREQAWARQCIEDDFLNAIWTDDVLCRWRATIGSVADSTGRL